MPEPSTWTLLDAHQGISAEAFELDAQHTPGAPQGFSVCQRRMLGGLSDGVDLLEINNGLLRLTVLPTRGMGVWRASIGDLRLGWDSPTRGPVHPKFVPLMEPGGLGWLDGFDELLVRCGLASNGPPVYNDAGRLTHPLHGRIANCPAHQVQLSVDSQQGEIRLKGSVDEARLFHRRLRLTTTLSTRFNEPGFRVTDEVTNLSAMPCDFQLLYHTNFGPPLLEAGSRFVAPVKTLVPRDAAAAAGLETWNEYGPPQAGFAEQAFFLELLGDAAGATQVLLRNRAADSGVSLRFNTRALPTFTLWKCTQAAADGYVTGLEPAINYPNARPFEESHGRVMKLAPSQSARVELALAAHRGAEEVRAAEAGISALQSGAEMRRLDGPAAPWAP